MPEILFASVHPPGQVPAQRFRYEQYVDYLADHGFRTHFSPVLHPDEHSLLYAPGNSPRKALIGGRSILRRIADVARSSRYDIVFVQREVIQLGSAFFERAFARSRSRLVFDFDDSIWLPNASEANRRLAWLKRPEKTSKIIAVADLVLAGNAYLRDYAVRFNPRVEVVPTTIDTERYVRADDARPADRSRVCIGWSGSLTTVQHFMLLIPVLARLRERFGDRVAFKVIGDPDFHCEELGIRGDAWNAHTEVSDLCDLDVGVMPLPDDEWAKGKCGLKGLQYMALAIPTVMSPVGVNAEIVDDGINGLLAGTDDEWFEKLVRLVEDADLRRRLGVAGRETVEARYSVRSQRARYLELLGGLLERPHGLA